MLNSRINKNIKKYRQRRGWSQEELAKRAGISYNTLIKIESGRIKSPTVNTALKIARAFSISLDKLVK